MVSRSIPNVATVDAWLATKQAFHPVPISTRFAQALFQKSKSLVSRGAIRPLSDCAAGSPYANTQTIYKVLHGSSMWVKFMPDSMTTGVVRFAGDLVNSASSGLFQRFLIRMAKLSANELDEVRKTVPTSANTDAEIAEELKDDTEFQALLAEQEDFSEAHPLRSKKMKLPPSGQGTKVRQNLYAEQLHGLSINASDEDRIACIKRVWPQFPHYTMSGKMTEFEFDDVRKIATVRVDLTLHSITYGISDPMAIPYLARLSGRHIEGFLSKEVKSRIYGNVTYRFVCDPTPLISPQLVPRPDNANLPIVTKTATDWEVKITKDADLINQVRRYRDDYYYHRVQRSLLKPKLVVYIDPLLVATYNFSDAECATCDICWNTFYITRFQVGICGHIRCGPCWKQSAVYHGVGVDAAYPCPSCREISGPQRPWCDVTAVEPDDILIRFLDETPISIIGGSERGSISGDSARHRVDPEPEIQAADGRPLMQAPPQVVREAEDPDAPDDVKQLSLADTQRLLIIATGLISKLRTLQIAENAQETGIDLFDAAQQEQNPFGDNANLAGVNKEFTDAMTAQVGKRLTDDLYHYKQNHLGAVQDPPEEVKGEQYEMDLE